MKILTFENFITEFSSDFIKKGSIVTIGNFDGCHLGHKQLLLETKKQALANSLTSIVLTFDPHPRKFFSKNSSNCSIFSPEQKIRAIKEMGLDLLIIQNFNDEFSKLSPEFFYKEGLINTLKAKTLILGRNFCFGSNKKGNIDWLSKRTQKDKVALQAIDLKMVKDQIINSTSIKKLITNGKIELANKLLGHHFSFIGTICSGNKLGRTLGFPTANISDIKQIIPAQGVYYGYYQRLKRDELVSATATPLDKSHLAVLNIGIKPTANQSTPFKTTIEAHIIGKKFKLDELYGEKCAFYFLGRVRDERKFPSLEELKQQIARDINQAQTLVSQ